MVWLVDALLFFYNRQHLHNPTIHEWTQNELSGTPYCAVPPHPHLCSPHQTLVSCRLWSQSRLTGGYIYSDAPVLKPTEHHCGVVPPMIRYVRYDLQWFVHWYPIHKATWPSPCSHRIGFGGDFDYVIVLSYYHRHIFPQYPLKNMQRTSIFLRISALSSFVHAIGFLTARSGYIAHPSIYPYRTR